MNGVKFWLEREGEKFLHLEIETAYLPNVGDFIEIRGEEFVVTKRLWTPDVEIKKSSLNDFPAPNGYGLKIIVQEA